MYADPPLVGVVTAGYMVGPEEIRDRKGHCPMMVPVEVKVGEPGEDEDEEQGSKEEGVSLQTPVRWAGEEADNKWQQCVQQVHVETRRGSHPHGTMRKAAKVCGFSRLVGQTQTQAKLRQLVPQLDKKGQEEVKVRAKAEGAD